jgi:5-methylcytosine-specific restriction protein A
MSNRRKAPLANLYRSEYLRSRAWFARRHRWFVRQRDLGIPLACAGCGQPGTAPEFELHHLDYRGVVCAGGKFRAREAHEDLTPMHPYCHELLHRLIDRDAVLAQNRSRRTATNQALDRLRRKLVPLPGGER